MRALVDEFAEAWSSKDHIGKRESWWEEKFEYKIPDAAFIRVLLLSRTPLTIGALSAINAAVERVGLSSRV